MVAANGLVAFVVPNCPQFWLSDLGITFNVRPCHRHLKAWGGCHRMVWLTWDVYELSEREFDQHEYASLWECKPNFLTFLKLLFSSCLYYTGSSQRQADETQSSSTMISLLHLPNLKMLITYGNCNTIKARFRLIGTLYQSQVRIWMIWESKINMATGSELSGTTLSDSITKAILDPPLTRSRNIEISAQGWTKKRYWRLSKSRAWAEVVLLTTIFSFVQVQAVCCSSRLTRLTSSQAYLYLWHLLSCCLASLLLTICLPMTTIATQNRKHSPRPRRNIWWHSSRNIWHLHPAAAPKRNGSPPMFITNI